MATIKQIAQKAGVSPTTVSNVLHGNTSKVSPAILKKVRAILEEEKYAPNMGAVILARNNSRIIGVILFMEPRSDETVLEDPFASTILGTLEQELRKHGYFMMLHTSVDKDEVIRLAATWKLDGLILLCVPSEVSGAVRKSIQTPVVFVDCYFGDDGQDYHNIGLDDDRGGYEMARHLLSKGHTRMAFMANSPDSPSVDSARFDGCRRAFAEEGLDLADVCYIPVSKSSKARHLLYRRLMAEPLEYTALFFSSDYYAADAVNYFYERGFDVPGRVSVAGFDDNCFSRLVRPHLTTVHQDVFQKGRSAVSMLMRLIRKEPVHETDVRLPVRLTIRDSVRPIEGTPRA
ncbi:MAG: LacI family transcriptional regulator [Spirochaetes bacterium]|nr:LacI family transcriptional regulator [Spirochaetota bacterium]MBU1079988.1 LacI family transcriptional regulator [Spirochaetota bacterium]